ncbi:hypothetical protein BDW60DRAFT_14461 [Aspergillus nidulans var. acristatus]
MNEPLGNGFLFRPWFLHKICLIWNVLSVIAATRVNPFLRRCEFKINQIESCEERGGHVVCKSAGGQPVEPRHECTRSRPPRPIWIGFRAWSPFFNYHMPSFPVSWWREGRQNRE